MNAFPVVSFNYVPAALEPDELGATQAHAHVPNIALPTRPHGRLDELVSRRAPHSPEAQFGGTPPQSWTATALRLPGPEQMVEGKEPPAEWPLIGIPTPGERPLPPLVNPSTAYTSADVERCESATPRRPQLPANCFKLNSQPHGKEIPPRADGIKTPKGKHFLPEIKNQVKELHREGKSAKEITQSIPGLRATQVASILQNWRDPQASTRCMKRKAEELSGNSGAKYTEYKKLQKANRSPGVRIVVVSFDS